MIRTSLCGVPYHIQEVDRQVLFEQKSGFYGCHSEFAFEWRGLGWYLIDTDSSSGGTFGPHLVAAMAWLEANYIVIYVDGTGTVKLKEGLVT